MPTALPPADDLYAALRNSGVRPDDLPDLVAASDPETSRRLRSVDQGLLRAVLRAGLGVPPIPYGSEILSHLATVEVAPIFRPGIGAGHSLALLTNGEHPDIPAFSDRAFDLWFAAKGVPYGLGTYGEDRRVYRSAQFADAMSAERRTRHLGIDVFAPAGTPVHAPLPGVVRHVSYQADPLDYGNVVILEHKAGAVPFYSLYGHLGGTLLALCSPGMRVAAGQPIGHLGDWHENGGWAAHLHFQVMTDMLEQTSGNFFGVGHASLWDVWQAVCPDPNLILRLDEARFRIG